MSRVLRHPTPCCFRSLDLVNPNLVNPIVTRPSNEQYSYNFVGNAQSLDHIILNVPASAKLTGYAHGRVNSDFAESNRGDSATPKRLSDHDPAVAYFSLPEAVDVTAQTLITRGGLLFNRALNAFTQSVTVKNTGAQPIAGPVAVIVTALPAGVTLANASGITTGGQPYLSMTPGTLAPVRRLPRRSVLPGQEPKPLHGRPKQRLAPSKSGRFEKTMNRLTSFIAVTFLLAAASAQAAPQLFTVSINTSSLLGAAAYLDFNFGARQRLCRRRFAHHLRVQQRRNPWRLFRPLWLCRRHAPLERRTRQPTLTGGLLLAGAHARQFDRVQPDPRRGPCERADRRAGWFILRRMAVRRDLQPAAFAGCAFCRRHRRVGPRSL